jgi:hypothetical protein
MNVKEAFQQHYDKMQAHHHAQAEDDNGQSTDCAALADCAKAAGDTGAAKAHASMAKRFANSAARHSEESDAYASMHKMVTAALATSKVMGDPDAVVPDGVQRVLREFPGLTAIPRTGQPSNPGKPNVPLQFEKLIAVEEE